MPSATLIALTWASDQLGGINVPERDVFNACVSRKFCRAANRGLRQINSNELALRQVDGHADQVCAVSAADFKDPAGADFGRVNAEEAGDGRQSSDVSLGVGSSRIRHSVVGSVHPFPNCLMLGFGSQCGGRSGGSQFQASPEIPARDGTIWPPALPDEFELRRRRGFLEFVRFLNRIADSEIATRKHVGTAEREH